jgi:hypothetical protein
MIYNSNVCIRKEIEVVSARIFDENFLEKSTFFACMKGITVNFLSLDF